MRYVSGRIYDGEGFIDGYAGIDAGRIAELGEGRPPETPYAEGTVVPGLVDCHTHVADAGLKVIGKMTLEELVAPPNGLKHRYLAETPEYDIVSSMKAYTEEMYGNGVTHFADFREGGEKGCRMLREASPVPRPVILGRPVSSAFDANEMDYILECSDGIGLPSISDMPTRYAEAVADHVRRKGKILSLHVSERIREDMDAVLSLEPDFIVHMLECSDGDLRKCVDNDVPIVVCPRSNMYFGKVPPVPRMLRHGATVGLGTDNAMLCSPDLREETAALVDILGKNGSDRDITEILLNNGRKILYDDREIKIKAGMDADIAVFPYCGHEDVPGIYKSAGRPVISITKREGE